MFNFHPASARDKVGATSKDGFVVTVVNLVLLRNKQDFETYNKGCVLPQDSGAWHDHQECIFIANSSLVISVSRQPQTWVCKACMKDPELHN